MNSNRWILTTVLLATLVTSSRHRIRKKRRSAFLELDYYGMPQMERYMNITSMLLRPRNESLVARNRTKRELGSSTAIIYDDRKNETSIASGNGVPVYSSVRSKKMKKTRLNEPEPENFSERYLRAKVKLSGDDPANDKVCLNLHPCEPGEGYREEEVKEYCFKYINDDSGLGLKCYNADPDPSPKVDDEIIVISRVTPADYNDGYEGVGFKIPESPVFRHSQFFDMDGVGNDYYADEDGPIDFEVLDWPGKTIQKFMQQESDRQQVRNLELGNVKECVQVLEFEGRSDKYLDYTCNAEEGLGISALGLIGIEMAESEDKLPESCSRDALGIIDPDEDAIDDQNSDTEPGTNPSGSPEDIANQKKPRQTYNRVYNLRCNLAKNRNHPDAKCAMWPIPSGKLYLARGNKTLKQDYIQPLVVSEEILRRLAQAPNGSEDEIPLFDGEPLQCNHFESRDIRTVLDFAFASDRLILGMKCGVILVKNIGSSNMHMDVAYLKISDRHRSDPDDAPSHTFPYMINIVAATPCCTTNKMCRHLRPLVAIYSAYAAYRSYPDDVAFYRDEQPKFIFVSVDNGDTFDRRVVASPDGTLNLMYWMYAKIPKWQIKNARPPDWIREKVFVEFPTLGSDFHEPVNPVTKFVMQGTLPKEGSDGSECHEIVSMASVSEENLLLVLCRYKKGSSVNGTNIYAVFSLPIRGSIPIISLTRRSKRKFSCRPMPVQRVWGKHEGVMPIEPSLVRIPNSYSVFILGCQNVLYYSSNGGKTIFLRSFFFNNTGGGGNGSDNESAYVLTRYNKFLTSYPLLAIDPYGQRSILTFGKYFVYGLTSSNTETSMVVGPVLRKLGGDQSGKGEPRFIPYFDESMRAGVGVVYLEMLKNSGQEFYQKVYKDRYGIRLLDCHISIHAHALPFYQETSGHDLAMSPCTTYAFKINTSAVSLDVGQKAVIRLSVRDNRKDVPLNVLLTHDKAANLRVSHSDMRQEVDQMMEHEWDIEITAKPYIIDRDLARVDAFFGAAYSNLEEVTSHLIINTQPQIRCHVQPRGHVSVRFGCNKYLAVHEDERRPQCAKFRNNFHYEIPHGHYDEDMAEYWKSERPKFYKIENGTLKITYDYEMFGCPVEPYRLDEYIPDLRLLPIGGNPNTSEGEIFKGNFILIEIFGASGYSYSKKVRNADCTDVPQSLEKMVQEWRVRVEAIKSIWYDYPHFDFDSVYAPLNIWNRVNYVACQGSQFVGESPPPEEEEEEEEAGDGGGDPDDPYGLGYEVLESPYEVMTLNAPEGDQNKLTWDPAIRQRVYIFLAIGVDPYNSYCTYHTYVPISLAVPKEEADWILIVIFFATLIFLLLLVVAGYYVRRHQVYRYFYKEAMFNRLLTAAWNLSFRYEKILLESKITDPSVKQQMAETRKLRMRRHTGVDITDRRKRSSKVSEIRHRIRQ